MEEYIKTNNSKIIIDKEVGWGGSYKIRGSNNSIHIEEVWVNKITLIGERNSINGTTYHESIDKLDILGSYNSIQSIQIKQLDILGYSNTLKNINYDDYQESNKNIVNENEINYNSNNIDTNQDSYFQSTIIEEESGNSDISQLHENFITSVPEYIRVRINQELSNDTNSLSDISFDSDTIYSDEDNNEPTQEVKCIVINSIISYPYEIKNEKIENWAICLWELKQKQQVKKLNWCHTFHSWWIDNWMMQKLNCPWWKASVYAF